MTKRKIDVDEVIGGQLETAVLKALATLKGKAFGDFVIEDMFLADDESSVWCTVRGEDTPEVKDHFEIFVEFVRRLEDMPEEDDDEEWDEDDEEWEDLDDDEDLDEEEDEEDEEVDEKLDIIKV